MAVDLATDGATLINQTLGRYGLQGLGPWVQTELVQGKSPDEILLDLYATPEFKARFPAIATRTAAGLPALSPEAYIQYEQTLDEQMARVGVLPGMRAGTTSFNNIVTEMLSNDVSIDEANARLEGGYAAVRDGDPSMRGWWNEHFGQMGDDALAAYYLSPEHSLIALQRAEREAEIGGSGLRGGVDVTQQMADRIAAINPSGSVDTQFSHLAQMAPLFQRNPGEANDLTAADQGTAAVFNLDPNSATEVQRAMDARAAQFAGHGVATEGAAGITGIGHAR